MGWYWLLNDLWFSFQIWGKSDFAVRFNQEYYRLQRRKDVASDIARYIDENRTDGNYIVNIKVDGGWGWDFLPISCWNDGKMSALETLESIVSELKGKYEKEL